MRFQSYTQRDTTDTTDGDTAWQGINTTLDKPTVSQGFLSRGENTRLRYGAIQQRKGTTIPGDFNPASGIANAIVGSGVFRNPNGDELLMIAPAGVTYTLAFQYGKDPVQINYETAVTVPPTAPTGTNGAFPVEFVQGFQNLIMLRAGLGSVQILVWDGTNTGKWKIMNLSAEGLKAIPDSWNGEPYMDRIIYYTANYPTVPRRDTWLISDVEDYTSYDDVFQNFRTNPGESDSITSIKGYFRGSIVVLKHQSIHLTTLQQTYPLTVTQRILSPHLGSIGNHMPLIVGADMIFLSPINGFYRLAEVIQEQITAQPTPISEPIQRVIDGINWPYTSLLGCSVALDNYAFFGVALGAGQTRLNAILVYDTQRKQWESAGDTWRDPGFGFERLELTNYAGVQRIFAIDYQNSIIYLLYEGVNDELKSGSFSVPFRCETRGYVGDGPISFKRFGRASVSIATYNPSLTVTAISDGFNEEKVIGQITKDRNTYYQHGHKKFDPLTDNADEQKRLDYSLASLDNNAIQDFEDLAIGPLAYLPGTTPNSVAGSRQESLERLLVRSFGRWQAFRFENDSGACDILGVSVESTPVMNTGRTAA